MRIKPAHPAAVSALPDAAPPPAAHHGPTGAAPPSTTPTDAATFGHILKGDVGVLTGFVSIAQNEGFPIRVPGGLLFAAPDEGQSTMSVAGDLTGWKSRPMKREGGVWWCLVPTNQAPSGYKLVQDGAPVADPWARSYRYDAHGELSLTRPGKGAHLERWPMLGGDGVDRRTVRVWVPAGKPTHQLYVQDGQNLFDPNAMWGGWQLAENLGPNTLVIGIDNTPSRMSEMTPVPDQIDGEWMGGGGDGYADFVVKRLKPFIEAQYGAPKRTGVLGSSLGGLISMHIAHRHPESFDFVGSMSGTLGWGAMEADGETIIDRYKAAPPSVSAIYIDSGGEPGGGDNYDPTRRMADTLAHAGYSFGEDLFHWHEPGAPHNEAAWRARAHRPIKIFESL